MAGCENKGASAHDAEEAPSEPLVIARAEDLWKSSTRRSFLRMLGMGGTAVLLPPVFSGCDDRGNPLAPSGPVTLNLGNDTGILNYAFALEQLEAGYYTAVVGSAAFNGMTAEQKEVFVDLRNHEVIHREFLRAALQGNAIGNLQFNENAVASATANTTTILRTSETFEDLGVSAYNGAGKYLTSPDLLTLAGKIVSVEARHAAAIRDMREGMGLSGAAAGTRFAGDDVVTVQGALDVKLDPGAVLQRMVASGFVNTQINVGTQPPTRQGTSDFGPPSPTP